ncbi:MULTISPECIES: hypothetical protein [unclassified Streptomyces]|uniref:hypothetical protein n=1 Tax=unclassified Streptomyces TaxID=2593676 RepID=UPI00382DE210
MAVAEALYREAAARGDIDALHRLGRLRKEAGDGVGAEAVYREAADHGDANPWFYAVSLGDGALLSDADHVRNEITTRWPYGLDPDGTPTPPWQDGAVE